MRAHVKTGRFGPRATHISPVLNHSRPARRSPRRPATHLCCGCWPGPSRGHPRLTLILPVPAVEGRPQPLTPQTLSCCRQRLRSERTGRLAYSSPARSRVKHQEWGRYGVQRDSKAIDDSTSAGTKAAYWFPHLLPLRHGHPAGMYVLACHRQTPPLDRHTRHPMFSPRPPAQCGQTSWPWKPGWEMAGPRDGKSRDP